jgi:geranylgeranyl reductase family protein
MKYDVVVVGAGPSGSTAAKILAEQGINTLLVDKEKFPRNKACGGGLPLRTLSRFQYIKQLNVIESYSYGGYVYSPSLEYRVDIKKSEPVLAMVLRSKFDNALVHLAIDKGVEFQDNRFISDVKLNPHNAQLYFKDGTRVITQLVIGADGAHSTIARIKGLIPTHREKGVCVLAEFPFTEDVIDHFFTKNRLCYLHSRFSGIKGYGWVFPKKNHVNVGIISYNINEIIKQKKNNIKKIFNEYLTLLKESKILPYYIKDVKIQGSILPVQPLQKTYFNHGLLCGDAAGLINPISGEGIHYALVSGELAGKVAANAINKQNTGEHFLSTYQIEWKKDFGKEIQLFLKSKHQWGKKGENLVKLMYQDSQFAELIFLIMIGKESVYDLRWKLIKRYLYCSLLNKVKKNI